MSPERNPGGQPLHERRLGNLFGLTTSLRSRRGALDLLGDPQRRSSLFDRGPYRTVFTEQDESSAFGFLPDRTRAFFRGYEYKGVKPPEMDAIGMPPSVIFLAADMKVPPEGRTKLLEFNGIGSIILPNAEGGQQAAAHTLYQVLEALDIPVYTGRRLGNSLINTDSEEGKRHGIHYDSSLRIRRFAKAPLFGRSPRLTDLQYADGILWTQYNKGFTEDDSRFLTVNPPELRRMVKRKDITHEVFTQAGMSDLRPRTWILQRKGIVEAARSVQDNADSTITKFVLKPSDLSRGIGIVLIERSDLSKRIHSIFKDRWSLGGLEGQDPMAYVRDTNVPYLLEEYIPSKPVVSEKDGKMYDGTLRIAFMVITNRDKMTMVPICSYWKLPLQPIGQEWNNATAKSEGEQEYPTAEVNPTDFSRAFADLAEAMPAVLQNAT